MAYTHQELIDELDKTHPALVELTEGLTDEILDFRAGPEEWSIREILAHLVDDEMFVMRTRLERMMKEDHPSLPSHDEKKWYAQRNRNRDQLYELLNDFAIQRTASLNILALLRDSDWQRTAYHPEYSDFSAEKWAEHWLEHDRVHLRQIASTIAAAR